MLLKPKVLPPAAGCGFPPPPSRSAEIPGKIIPGKNDSVAAIPGKKPG